ncbi:GxxExxY protein [Bythopirellula goksoeyrii]|uniref:GxxExxY protein n=1 Tax=Bythopirellula goksoeyrii TaxID=1400387 RepID=A0A5B9QDH1_9BACT|nr:GxxExxY protein [Bythopirellula goksoeyrii]QEG35675.1 hypothetical protein Pr1d_29770 [Bythopirellula goksoeyrii]
MSELILEEESYAILGACFEVYNEIGCGFLEAVYQECLEIEFSNRGIPYVSKPEVSIRFGEHVLQKKYEADFICYDQIIVKVKATSQLLDHNTAQTLNYLHATKLPLGLLANFGHHPKLQYKRIALTKKSS